MAHFRVPPDFGHPQIQPYFDHFSGKMWYHILGHFLAETLSLFAILGMAKNGPDGSFLDTPKTTKLAKSQLKPLLNMAISGQKVSHFKGGGQFFVKFGGLKNLWQLMAKSVAKCGITFWAIFQLNPLYFCPIWVAKKWPILGHFWT